MASHLNGNSIAINDDSNNNSGIKHSDGDDANIYKVNHNYKETLHSHRENIQHSSNPSISGSETDSQRDETLTINENEVSPYVYNIQGCATPPVDDKDDTVENPSETVRDYSKNKVRLLLPIITCFYFSHGTLKTILFQYLLDRWSKEAGLNQNTSNFDSMCDRNGSDPAAKEADAIQSRVADAYVYYGWCSTGTSFVACLLFGAFVDLIGRKPALLISQLGTTLQALTIVIIIKYNLSTNFFYFAYSLDGIGGGFVVFLVANLSATADVSDTKKRRIAWITIVLTFSHLFASATDIAIGLVIDNFGYVAASLTIFSTISVGFLISGIFLPETLPTKRQRITFKKVREHNSRVLYLYTRDGSKETRWSLFLSLIIFTTMVMVEVSVSTSDTLYQKHEPLCWDSEKIGYYSAFRSATRAVFGLLYLGMTRCIGCTSDEVNSMISTLFMAGGFVMEAFSKTDWEMYMAPIISIPSSNLSPITRGVMSFLAGPGKQGALFSSIALIEVIGVLIGRTAYSRLYAATVAFMPGTVYFVMAGTALITFLVYIPFFHFYERPPKSYDNL